MGTTDLSRRGARVVRTRDEPALEGNQGENTSQKIERHTYSTEPDGVRFFTEKEGAHRGTTEGMDLYRGQDPRNSNMLEIA